MGRPKKRKVKIWHRHCHACGKINHRTKADGKAMIRRLERCGKAAEHPRADEPLHVYRCPVGDGWHVGHDRSRRIFKKGA